MTTLSAQELIARKKPLTRKVTIVLDGDLADKWNAAEAAFDNARFADERGSTEQTKLDVIEAEDALDELRPQMAEATIEFTLRAIGRKQYADLMEQHPPTDEQRKDARRAGTEATFDGETFYPAVIAASLVEPQMSEEDVKELFDSEAFNAAEVLQFVSAVIEVNQSRKTVDLKKGVSAQTGG